MAPLRPVGGVMEATFIFNTLSCATVCLLAYMWHDPSHQLQWAGWCFQCTDSTWRLTNNKLWHVFTSCHIHLKMSLSWMYFLFITFIVFVLFAGVFNSAEAWRQCHIGHDVEGKTAAKMWDWHKHHHLQLHQQIVLIWRNKCILPHDSDLFSVSCLSVCLCHSCLLAAQTSRHAGGEEPHRASPGRHLRPRPHPESPQLRPLGTRLLHVV